VARQDYLPFGEEIPAGYAGRSSSLLFGASDGVEQKFTGQIRDSETGMDFFTARYYGSALGRFLSPDPANAGADLLDPQTWNAYAYVRNNPLALVDPMGMCTFDAEGNAVEDENGACYQGGFGGSVTVVAQAPPDVMPIFVSLPSLLSDNQQPAPTAPPPAVTEAGVSQNPETRSGPGVSDRLNRIFDRPWVLSWIIPVVGAPFVAGIGLAGDLEWNPNTHTACVGIGIGASAGHNATVGPLTNGRMFNGKSYPSGVDNVLGGWSLSLGGNTTALIGGQLMINGSGWAAGPSVGVPGVSMASTYSACVTF
jgi:RHS repeat-associated protein